MEAGANLLSRLEVLIPGIREISAAAEGLP
jgi:hypothetical protein